MESSPGGGPVFVLFMKMDRDIRPIQRKMAPVFALFLGWLPLNLSKPLLWWVVSRHGQAQSTSSFDSFPTKVTGPAVDGGPVYSLQRPVQNGEKKHVAGRKADPMNLGGSQPSGSLAF